MELDTIYNMDCMEGMKGIADGSIDMILCDPPYGTTENKWDSVLPLEELWLHYRRITKHNGAILLFSQMPFTATVVISNPRQFRYEWIWEKTNPTGFLNANKMPLKVHENILVFYDRLPLYNPQFFYDKPYRKKRQSEKYSANYGKQMRNTTNSADGRRYPRDNITFGSVNNAVHPTQKPVALCEYLIRTYTNEGETVLDNCMGSGTTAVAAINTGRHFIGFEKEKEYFDIAMKRIEEAQAQTRLAL